MDTDVIKAKLVSLQRCMQRIRQKTPSSAQHLAADFDLQDILILNLQRAVQISTETPPPRLWGGADRRSAWVRPSPHDAWQIRCLTQVDGALTPRSRMRLHPFDAGGRCAQLRDASVAQFPPEARCGRCRRGQRPRPHICRCVHSRAPTANDNKASAQ